MHVSVWAWAVLLVATPILLALDLFVFPRGRDAVDPRSAFWWSVVWALVGLAFAGVVWIASSEALRRQVHHRLRGGEGADRRPGPGVRPGGDQLRRPGRPGPAGHLPGPVDRPAGQAPLHRAGHRHRPLRAGEPALGHRGGLHGRRFVFLLRSEADPDADQNRYLRWLSHRIDFTDDWRGDHFVVVDEAADDPARPAPTGEPRRRRYTLAFAMLVVLLTADIYFAATVPLAFAIKKPGFLVLASSTFALLGIRSLYWWVTSLEVDRVKLRIALADRAVAGGPRAGARAVLPRGQLGAARAGVRGHRLAPGVGAAPPGAASRSRPIPRSGRLSRRR